MRTTATSSSRIFRLATLLAALACGLTPTLYAGSISAFRDEKGRVVFVNETAAEYPGPQASPSDSGVQGEAAPSVTPSQEQIPLLRPARTVFRAVWDEMIELAAKRHQVDPDLVRAIVKVESNFNPAAVSSRGAKGLMQLMPATARRFGVRNVFDPKANLDGGVRYLKYLMEFFGGDLRLSLAAYNAGENAVGRHKGVPPFPETRDYLRRIAEIYPLSASRPAIASSGIGKFVDSNGVVHFSNTDMP